MRARQFDWKYGIALVASLTGANSNAQESNLGITRGVLTFSQYLANGETNGLASASARCWAQFASAKKRDQIAQCFVIDYLASDYAEFVETRRQSLQPEYFKIQRVFARVNVSLKELKVEQAERGKLIAEWISLSQAALVSASAGKTSSSVTNPAEKFEDAKRAVQKQIRNGSRFAFDRLSADRVLNFKGELVDVVCGTVVFQNSSGERSGPRRFVYFTSDKSAHYDDRKKYPYDLNSTIVKNFCSE